MLAPIISDARFYLFAVPAVIFLGLAKGGFSGAATAATPLLALYLPPLEAAALLLPLVLCQDAISLQVYWRRRSTRNLKVLLPGAIFGVALGSAGYLWRMFPMMPFASSLASPHSLSSPMSGSTADIRSNAMARY